MKVWILWGCAPGYDGGCQLLGAYATKALAQGAQAKIEKALETRRRKLRRYFDDGSAETPYPKLTKAEELAEYCEGDGFAIGVQVVVEEKPLPTPRREAP